MEATRLQIQRGVLEEDDDEEEGDQATPLLVRDSFSDTWHVQDKQSMYNLSSIPTRDVWTMPEVGGETPVARWVASHLNRVRKCAHDSEICLHILLPCSAPPTHNVGVLMIPGVSSVLWRYPELLIAVGSQLD
eukprot:6498026-Pyramimonas_sp.AAC.1